MRYPAPLKNNGTIGFPAPSFGCNIEPYFSSFNNAQKILKEKGHGLLCGPNAYAGDGIGISSSPESCGREFTQMRVCHMWEGAGTIRFGIYACSPEDSSFTAVFTNMKLTECMWKAHDGQQPDEE